MHSERDNHAAVDQPAKSRRAKAGKNAQRETHGGRYAAQRALRPVAGKIHGRQAYFYYRYRAHREIDAAGDNYKARPDRHDRNEAGVFGQLRQVLGVEELIPLDYRRFLLTLLIESEYPLALALGIRLEEGHFDPAAKHGQQGAENDDDDEQTTFLQAQPPSGCGIRRAHSVTDANKHRGGEARSARPAGSKLPTPSFKLQRTAPCSKSQ